MRWESGPVFLGGLNKGCLRQLLLLEAEEKDEARWGEQARLRTAVGARESLSSQSFNAVGR